MIQTVYLGRCDVCGDLSAVPNDTAEVMIKQADIEEGPPLVSRCAMLRDTDTDDHEVCTGDVYLYGCVPLMPLPTVEQLIASKLPQDPEQ